MSEIIKHDGVVERILDDSHLQVRIVQTSACASCKAAGHCTSAESKEKIVDVWVDDTRNYAEGQNVIVMASMKTGMTAVLIGFVAPVVLVLLAVVITLQLTSTPGDGNSTTDQAFAALAGLLVLIPYYLVLYSCRSVLKSKFAFWLA